MVSWKGALAAPFVFTALVLAAVGSAVASPLLWFAALAFIALAVVWRREQPAVHLSAIALAVACYTTWMIVDAVLNDSYTPASFYHPMFLAGGFLLGRSADQRTREQTTAALAAGAILLAFWALWQAASGEGRAHAHFETPNTLATLLNLLLAPLLFTLVYVGERRSRVALAVLLTAALTATLSRGGIIALGGGLLGTMVLFGVRPQRAGLGRIAAILVVGAAIGTIALSLPQWLEGQYLSESSLTEIATTLAPSTSSRGELYRLAFSNLGEHPWLGTGYLGFRALLEAHRADVPSYAMENITYFVHDDYLQTVMELGVPGLLLLLAMVIVPFSLAKRADTTPHERLELFAALAGLATMAIHALGDFPFYVPICLLVFGFLLGGVDARLPHENGARAAWHGRAVRLSALGLFALLAVLLVPPPLAEAAAWYSDRSWQQGKTETAAYGLELARRLQSRDWRYHWYAGQFWYAQASAGNVRAAILADRAFAAAVAANPHEPQPLLARLATQIRFAALLARPQPAATLRRWADEALALAPLNPAVRRDYTAAVERLSEKR